MVATKMKFHTNKVVNGVVRSYYFMDLAGKESETRPTIFEGNYVEEGSTFIEEDTGKVSMMQSDYTWGNKF